MGVPQKRGAMLLALAGAGWLMAVAAGFAWLDGFAATPGVAPGPPAQWPGGDLVSRRPDAFTLILGLHPRCPCSRTSLDELATIRAACGGAIDAIIVLSLPGSDAAEWRDQPSVGRARAVTGIEPVLDTDGSICSLFRFETSGSVALYDPQGRLRYTGGITPGRGMIGENAGRRAVIDLVRTGTSAAGTMPVFGCSILTAGAKGTPAESER